MSPGPALLLIGHGSRSAAGVDEYWQFADVLRSEANGLEIGCGFIELAEPDLDAAIDTLVSRGVTSIGAVPLVLLGAGHMKNDGPAALERGRRRHQGVRFEYGRSLGIHPLVLALAEDRIRAAVGADDPGELGVVLVGRGSSDPDANADLYKVGRLLQDSRGLGLVEPAFISLSPPSVPEALERCRRLGATTIAVVPYFLFTGILVDRIHDQADAWAADHPDVAVRHRRASRPGCPPRPTGARTPPGGDRGRGAHELRLLCLPDRDPRVRGAGRAAHAAERASAQSWSRPSPQRWGTGPRAHGRR